jgi:hypothetical protein
MGLYTIENEKPAVLGIKRGKTMPRLIGRRSNDSPYLGLLVAIVAIAAVAVEYLGVTDVVPAFGRDQMELKLTKTVN